MQNNGAERIGPFFLLFLDGDPGDGERVIEVIDPFFQLMG
jgi:hypothetical protein